MQHSSSLLTGNVESELKDTQRNTGKLLATQGYVVGIELSGMRLSVALAGLDGTILYRRRRSLEGIADPKHTLALFNELLAEVVSPHRLERGRILRVGVAVGGIVDAAHGVIRTLHYTHGWDDFPLQDYCAEKLGAPCIIDSSAKAAALAEVCLGVGMGERVVLYVALGQSIGGALVINGKVYHGAASMAGEIGHMLIIKEDGPKCSCGGFGHLEALVSAQAIVRDILRLSVEAPETEAALRRVTGDRAERISAVQVFELAAEGDKMAQHIVSNVHTYLADALTNIVLLVNPSMIILGGSVARAGDLLLLPIQARIQQTCIPAVSSSLQVVQDHLGSESNVLGAVTLALQDL